MKLSFDKFERYEMSQVTLCNPNSRATEVDGKITITDTVGVLSNPKGMNLKLNFNAPHELSFDYYRHKSSDPIKQSFYDSIYEAIQTDRYIYLTDIGYFVISSVTDSDEDNIDKKSISCKSCEENELTTAEGLHLKEGTYYLRTDNSDGLLDLFLPKTAGWTIGYIDPSLLTKPYYVEDTEVDNGYNFLYTTIQAMFECIVEPDIIKRTISVYSRAYYAEHHLTDIHIAKYNLLKHKTVEENDEDKYTALNVQGKDENLEIRTVNPTGKNVIYNFEPRYSWMSSELQIAIEKWQEKCEAVEEDYLTLQQGYYTEQELLFNKQKDIEVLELGLKQLQSTRDFITTGAADNYLENIKLYCTQYNANVNGNVDYAKRPFISPEEMVLAGYPEFSNPDEEVATTYDCDYAFMNGSGSVLYTIKMTPIMENRNVLSVEGLDAYYDQMASSCFSKEQLLAYDAAHWKLIINIDNGDTPRDSEGLTALDKTLMSIKNNHWSTVKAFMKAAGLDMANLSNLLNEIENRQTTLSYVNSAIDIKQDEINKMTSDYDGYKATTSRNYEVPINQINADCALDITAVDIHGNTIFTTELLNELMTHIKPTDYVDEYMLVTESMTYPQKFEKAKELMDRAQSQLVKISSGQKTYSIDTRSFLFNKQFKHFSEQLCAGAIIYTETKRDTMEQLHLTGIDIDFDAKTTNFTLGNKYDRSDLKALYDDALGQNSKSFSELKYIASIIEDQQKQLDYQRNWVADLRTLTLNNVLTSEDQAFEINNRGIIGRKRRLDENGEWDFDENDNPYFEDEQVKLINNTLVFTEDNWNTASTAVGKIAVGYNSDGSVKYSYGINGQVLIGELILGNNLVLTGTGAGIKIKDSNGNDAFYADNNGNLVLSGTIYAQHGEIAGWEIESNYFTKVVDIGNNSLRRVTIGSDSSIPAFGVTSNDWNTGVIFRVNWDGSLYATQGQIAEFSIDGSTLHGGSVGMDAVGGAGRDYAFWAGAAKGNSVNAPFKVGHDGSLFTTSGAIGGWTINGNGLFYQNGTIGCGLYGTDAHANIAIHAGANQQNIGGAPFRVYHDGSLVASRATITGTLQAGSIIETNAKIKDGVQFGSSGYTTMKDRYDDNHPNDANYAGTLWHHTYSGNWMWLNRSGLSTNCDLNVGGIISIGSGQISSYWSSEGNHHFKLNTSYNYLDLCVSDGIKLWCRSDKSRLKGTWELDTGAAVTSDRRQKNSVNNIDDKYDILFDNLLPVTYKYNYGTSDRLHTGFIAQDVKQAMDVALIDSKSFAALTIGISEDNEELWSLRYDEFIALNTWQIQRCKKKIADLENTIVELKTQIQNLTAG